MEDMIRGIQEGRALDDIVDQFGGMSTEQKTIFLRDIRGIRTEHAGDFLNLVYAQETEKDIRKEIKRLIFRLRTIGVKVKEPEVSGESVLRKIEDKRDYKGFMSNYDIHGTMIASIALQARKNNYLFVDTVIHFSRGLTELVAAPVLKPQLDDVIEGYRNASTRMLMYVGVSPLYVINLIERANKISGAYTQEIRQLKQVITATHAGIGGPEDIYTLKVPEGNVPVPVEQILDDDLFKSFVLPWENYEEDRRQFDEIRNSKILVPLHMVEEKKEAYIDAMIQREEFRSYPGYVKEMLENYAYICYALERYGEYGGLIKGLQEPDMPFRTMRSFIKKALEHKGDEQQDEQQDTQQEGGLIVNPYEQIHR